MRWVLTLKNTLIGILTTQIISTNNAFVAEKAEFRGIWSIEKRKKRVFF